MIVIRMPRKIRAETAADAGGHAMLAQNRTQHQRKVPARRQRAGLARPRTSQRPRIDPQKLIQAFGHWQGGAALTGKRSGVESLPLDPGLVDQQPVQDAT